MTKPKHIAVFASGSGTNFQRLAEHFAHSAAGRVVLLVCNKPTAGVLGRAQALGVPAVLISREDMKAPDRLLQVLREAQVDLVVLAGFLWRVPAALVQAYEGKMLNIHPSLLPKYGGKGMYGMNVHQAVKDSGDTETGITIHWVNEHYDEGAILFQAAVAVTPTDSPEAIAHKVHQLEYEHFPTIVEQQLL